MIRFLVIIGIFISVEARADVCETSCSVACKQKLQNWSSIIAAHNSYCGSASSCSREQTLMKSFLGIVAANCPDRISYPDGRTAKSGPHWYHRNGSHAGSIEVGYFYVNYPTGQQLYNGQFAGTYYHPDGSYAHYGGSDGVLVHSNGQIARNGSRVWFYPEGQAATNYGSRTIFDRNGSPIGSYTSESEVAAVVTPNFGCAFPILHPFCAYFIIEE